MHAVRSVDVLLLRCISDTNHVAKNMQKNPKLLGLLSPQGLNLTLNFTRLNELRQSRFMPIRYSNILNHRF